ncbi:MAG: GAF domain-containing sensor histidine kinase [Ignavibacteriales bacterium]|nr:GAF domain-containing sensor histidine kinase [Ignavibacteriales bacterium]
MKYIDHAILTIDPSGQILSADRAALAALDCTFEELRGRSIGDLLTDDDRSQFAGQMQILRRDGYLDVLTKVAGKGASPIKVHAIMVKRNEAEYLVLAYNSVFSSRRDHELLQRNKHALALYELGRRITSTFDVSEVLDAVVRNTVWLLECHFAGIALTDKSRSGVSFQAVMGAKSDITCLVEIEAWKNISGHTIFKNFPTDPPVDPDSYPFVKAENLRSLLAVPLVNKGKGLGFLVIGYRKVHRFSEAEIQLAASLADQTALAAENARLYRESVEYSRTMSALSARLTVVQEEERRRITRDLHDGVGQALSGLRLNLDLLSREVPLTSETAQERLTMMKDIIDETMTEIRQISHDLRPPVLDAVGLVAALRMYVDRFAARYGIAVKLIALERMKRIDQQVEATVYRVVQEALSNIVRHSGATKAQIELVRKEHVLFVQITDNGKGFDPVELQEYAEGRNGRGIPGMRERIEGLQGTYEITSAKGKGTTIAVELPIDDRSKK